jgi:adenylate kinase
MPKRLLIFGPPAAGKGTHARRLASDLRIPHIATGDMLRHAISRRTPLGQQAERHISGGELVPDELVTALVSERLGQEDTGGFVLDGFPRTVPQAEALAALTPVDAVLSLDAPEDLLVARIAGRATCSSCTRVFHDLFRPPVKAGRCDECGGTLVRRPDDEPSAVRKRLAEYHVKTAPVLRFFAEHAWPVRDIDAAGDEDDVYVRIQEAV